jgi:hypothetical protein
MNTMERLLEEPEVKITLQWMQTLENINLLAYLYRDQRSKMTSSGLVIVKKREVVVIFRLIKYAIFFPLFD